MEELDPTDDDQLQAKDVRTRIVAAAAALIEAGGRDAATTRAVAAAGGVQAPTIYRLFGDKRGLLEAVAEHGLSAYIAEKSTRPAHPDPVQDLRDGWDMHVAFGLANPGLFAIISSDPHPDRASPAVAAGLDILRRRVRNIALAGRLRTSEERAVELLHSMGTGTILTLLGQPENARDPGLSEAARETLISVIIGKPVVSATSGPSGAAAALHACLDQTSTLSRGERHLLEELLDRIAVGEKRP
jgi:AcrR family transcriptional regulator